MKKSSVSITLGLWAASVAVAYFAGHGTRPAAISTAGGRAAATGVAVATTTAGGQHVVGSSAGKAGTPWQAGQDKTAASPRDQSLASVRAALANPNAIERTQAILGALDGLDNEGMRQAYELIRAQDDGMAARTQNMLLMYAWARKDPEAAIAFNRETGNDRANMIVMSSWAQVAPDKAIAWASADGQTDEQGNPTGDNWSMLGVISGLVKSDIGKAAEAVQMMNRSRARGDALDAVIDKFSKTDPDGARRWVAGIPDAVLRAGAAERLGRTLAQSDPTQAAAWVATLPDATSKSRAADGLIGHWAQTDPNAAGEWLKSSFPAGPDSDGPRETFATMIDGRDPQSALAWAGTISDPSRREAVMTSIAKDWLRREGDAARALLQQTPNLPESFRNRLRQR